MRIAVLGNLDIVSWHGLTAGAAWALRELGHQVLPVHVSEWPTVWLSELDSFRPELSLVFPHYGQRFTLPAYVQRARRYGPTVGMAFDDPYDTETTRILAPEFDAVATPERG